MFLSSSALLLLLSRTGNFPDKFSRDPRAGMILARIPRVRVRRFDTTVRLSE